MTRNCINYKIIITHYIRCIKKSEKYKERIHPLPKGSSLADLWNRAKGFEDH